MCKKCVLPVMANYDDDGGCVSYSENQKIFICDTPEALGDRMVKRWRDLIERRVNKAIEDKKPRKKLRKMQPDEECNLFVTFYIERDGDKHFRGVDALLKPLCDALKERDKNDHSKQYLMRDDNQIRGIRSEKERVVRGEKPEGVDIQYVITKTFKIKGVEIIEKEEELAKYGNDWKYPMQIITAYEVSKNTNYEKGPYKFIDNAPRRLFLANEDDINAKFIPPGYNWGHKIGKRVDGCMVFKKEALEKSKDTEPDQESLYLLTKWL